MKTPAYIEGEDAYDEGEGDEMNPYDADSLDYDEWQCGWEDRAAEEDVEVDYGCIMNKCAQCSAEACWNRKVKEQGK